MTERAAERLERGQRWPMTSEACERLVDEIAQLRQDLSALAGQGLEEGIVRLSLATAARRLDTLQRVLECSDIVVHDAPVAAIGRRATLRDEDGESVCYAIVFPGDGDPTEGWISADSPLGAAILGRRPGETVAVDAPVGPWRVTLVQVE